MGPFPSAVATTRASPTRILHRRLGGVATGVDRVTGPVPVHRVAGGVTGGRGAGIGVVVDDPERLHLEERRLPPRGLAQQELERAVGHLEVVPAVLEGLQRVEHLRQGVGVELEPELLRP